MAVEIEFNGKKLSGTFNIQGVNKEHDNDI